MLVHMFMYVWIHVWMLAYGGQQSALSLSLSSPPYLVFGGAGETRSHFSLGLTNSARLAVQRVPNTDLVLPPQMSATTPDIMT